MYMYMYMNCDPREKNVQPCTAVSGLLAVISRVYIAHMKMYMYISSVAQMVARALV